MKILGIILIIAGAIVVAMGGMRYLKDRDTTHVGPIHVTTEEHGFITPLAGLVGIGAGVLLLTVGGRPMRRA
jgi:hypothetical protein